MICLDTCVLSYAVKGYRENPTDINAKKAFLYMESLGGKDNVMVPTLVISEYLAAFPVTEMQSQIDALADTGFFQPAFDARAAHLAAELYVKWVASGNPRVAKKQAFKMDTAIAAVALAHGATTLVTANGGDFENLLIGTRVKVIDIPDVAVARRVL